MPYEGDSCIYGNFLEVIKDMGNIDYLPHPGDRIQHRCGAITTFTNSTGTAQGAHLEASTLLPSTIHKIQIEGTVQL